MLSRVEGSGFMGGARGEEIAAREGGNYGSAPYGGAHGKAAILYLHLYRPIRAIQMQVEDSGFMGGARGVEIAARE